MAGSSAHAHTHGHDGGDHGGAIRTHSHASTYIKIWLLLLVLLVISIVGPMFEIRIVTLITAFGIAFVKAAIVCAYFMHLNIEKKYIWYILATMLLMMGLFFAGVMTDILKKDGQRWQNKASYQYIEKYLEHPEPGHHGSSDGGGAHQTPAEQK